MDQSLMDMENCTPCSVGGIIPTSDVTTFLCCRATSGFTTSSESVKTTPQMTRFRDAKVCNNLVTDEIDDHRVQSDYKCTTGLQNPEGKNSTLGIAYAW